MIKTQSIGPEDFKRCLVRAMQWYGVYKRGFAQKDLLPTAAYFAKLLLEDAGISKKDGAWMCSNGLRRGGGRLSVKREIKQLAEVERFECMVDIYCGVGRKEPYRPLLTMECEGASGYSREVGRSATSDNCDYLWDLFKLLQVPSPLRIFLGLCTKSKEEELRRKIDRHVTAYRHLRKPSDVVYAVLFPDTELAGKAVTVSRWSGRRSTGREYPLAIRSEDIRRVKQGDDNGCGIACVAMVAGKTYRQANEIFDEHVFTPTDKKPRARHYQLRRALKKMGIATKKKLFRSWGSIQDLSIVPITRRVDTGWHWVVYVPDGRRPYILDPMPEKGRRRYDFRGMRARGLYIAVEN